MKKMRIEVRKIVEVNVPDKLVSEFDSDNTATTIGTILRWPGAREVGAERRYRVLSVKDLPCAICGYDEHFARCMTLMDNEFELGEECGCREYLSEPRHNSLADLEYHLAARKTRLQHLIDLKAPEPIIEHGTRLVEEAQATLDARKRS